MPRGYKKQEIIVKGEPVKPAFADVDLTRTVVVNLTKAQLVRIVRRWVASEPIRYAGDLDNIRVEFNLTYNDKSGATIEGATLTFEE